MVTGLDIVVSTTLNIKSKFCNLDLLLKIQLQEHKVQCLANNLREKWKIMMFEFK